jgi:hypothetical protein
MQQREERRRGRDGAHREGAEAKYEGDTREAQREDREIKKYGGGGVAGGDYDDDDDDDDQANAVRSARMAAQSNGGVVPVAKKASRKSRFSGIE